jgi:D-sedoheptulose 7-phosphate isomerase
MDKNKLIEEIEKVYEHTGALKQLVANYKQIIILGNGGSSAVASHISQDYTKMLGKRAFTFSDASRLTCYSNDYGYHKAYAQFVKEFADKDTLVVLISSSGNSKNITNAANRCEVNQIPWIAVTGFDAENKLHTTSYRYRKLNVWVDSKDYGIVECVHQIFLHSII